MKSFEEYIECESFNKCVLYKDLTGKEPSKEELVEFLHSEYDYDLIYEVNNDTDTADLEN